MLLNVMKTGSILKIPKIIQIKRKVNYSFSSVILKEKKLFSFNPTISLKEIQGTGYGRDAFSVFHFSSKNIKINNMCSQ